MPIIIDGQLRERMVHDATVFPISYFRDELATLPNWAGPMHWHSEFEIATAESNTVDFQVGQKHFMLEAGDSIFVNGNILHGIRQLSSDKPDSLPNIVFSGTIIASETSAIYQKYVRPIADCNSLPFIVFRRENGWHKEVNGLVKDIYYQLSECNDCYEMAVQRNLNYIFEYLVRHFDELPKTESTRIQINAQIRIQRMLAYIYAHYAEAITLDDIAEAASISRSEASRCFNAYIGCTPIEALIQYRLQTAYRLLHDTSLTLQEISHVCGFNSASYFSRRFKQFYGYAPGQKRNLRK